jgi:hypothetical protein
MPMSLLDEKVDRLENHFKIYKSDMQDVKGILKSVETCLIGSNLNGHKGITHLLDDIDVRVKDIEKKQILHEEAFKNYKWGVRSLVVGMCTIIYGYFKNK